MYVDYARRYVVYPLLLITVNITSHSVVLLVLEYAGATASQKDNDNDNLFNFYTNTLTPRSPEAHRFCVSIPRGGNSGNRLAQHDTSADAARPETEDRLLKFDQSSTGARAITVPVPDCADFLKH